MKNSIRKRIKEIKKEIRMLEVIRPGKLSKQKRGTTQGRYNYLSYTFQNKGRTEYIRGKYLDSIGICYFLDFVTESSYSYSF